MAPKISICVPTLNRAYELKRTLDSILKQTFKDFELIVVDDGSNDNTSDIVRDIGDSRVKYFKNTDRLGIYPNWNRCLELARGEYIAIYHDNDLYDPSIVERCVNILSNQPEVSFVFTGCQTIDSAQNVIHNFTETRWPKLATGKKVARRMARRWSSFVQASTVMARRELYNRVGNYAANLGLPGDMDMWVRLAGVGDVAYIQEPLVKLAVRRPGEFTSQPKWRDVQALAYIQMINWRRAYADSRLMLVIGDIWRPIRRDCGYLFFLAYSIIHGHENLIQESIDVFKKECLLPTRVFRWFLKKSPIVRYILNILLPLYRFFRKERIGLSGDFSAKEVQIGNRLIIECCVCSTKRKFVKLMDLSESQFVFCCPECGVMRIWPPADIQDDSTNAYQLRVQEEDRWRWFAEDTFYFLTKHIGSSARTLLDIGCSTGVIVEKFSQHKWLTKGIDIDRHAVIYGQNRGRDLMFGTIDSLDEKFDVILLSHLFEHLNDPGPFLEKVLSRLNPDGCLFIMTPTYKSFSGWWYRERWNGWVPGQHEWIYSKNSMMRLLYNHGFIAAKICKRIQRGWPEDGWWRRAFWWKRLPLIIVMRLSGVFGQGDGLYVIAQQNNAEHQGHCNRVH